MTRIAIIGGGPAGYEAAQVAAGLDAQVTLIESDGIGGACVLYDCVPSKTLIATSERVTALRAAPELGLSSTADVRVRLQQVNRRVQQLAASQSDDIRQRLAAAGVQLLSGRGRFAAEQSGRTYRIEVQPADGQPVSELEADVVLLATGGTPRILPGAEPDGERVLSWRDIYRLAELPSHLIVVGSGVTGAEFASAYSEMGVPTTLVSSRQKVLPGEDPDAADVIEQVFTSHGGMLMKQARAQTVKRTADGVEVVLTDGRTLTGSHALMCVGSVPNTEGLGLRACRAAAHRGRLRRGGPGVADRSPRHLRRRGLHRRAAAGLGGGHAGPGGDVARARRGGAAAAAEDGCRQRVHPSGDRHRRHRARRGQRR